VFVCELYSKYVVVITEVHLSYIFELTISADFELVTSPA